MYWYGSAISGWGYALMTIGTILFWSAVIFGIVALVRYPGRRGQPRGAATAALPGAAADYGATARRTVRPRRDQ